MSNLSDIGIPVNTVDEYNRLFAKLWKESAGYVSTPLDPTIIGHYRAYKDMSGAEVWMSKDSKKAYGLNCHFSGDTVWKVGVERIARSPKNEMDGVLFCWADAQWYEDTMEWSGLFPFVVNVPDFQSVNGYLKPPATVEIQLCALATSVSIFKSREDYEADALSNAGSLQRNVESFIPLDISSREFEDLAYSSMSGVIRGFSYEVNSFTGRAFWLADVQTLGGNLNVLCDPELIEGTPLPGSIVIGDVYMSGRLVS